jgi:hypothetical protein
MIRLAAATLSLALLAGIAAADVEGLLQKLETLERGRPLAARLRTPAGRTVLAERLEEVRDEARESAARAALERMLGWIENDPEGGFATWVAARGRERDAATKRIQEVLRVTTVSLDGRDPVARDLRTLLRTEAGVRRLERHLLAPAIRRDPLARTLGRYLTVDDRDGMLAHRGPLAPIERRGRERAAEAAAALEALQRGAAIVEDAPEELTRLLRDELFLPWLLRASARVKPEASFADLAAGLRAGLDVVRRDPTALAKARAKLARERWDLEEMLLTARIAARRLREGEEPEEAWRRLLLDPAIVLLPPARGRRPSADPAATLLTLTPLGRWLARNPDATWRVHRLLAAEADHGLRALREADEELVPLRDLVARWAEAPDSSLGQVLTPGGIDELISRARQAAEAEGETDAVAILGDELVREARAEGDDRPETSRLLRAAGRAAREIEATGKPLLLDPTKLPWRREGLHLLRSSVFYNPRTAAGAWLYHARFPDHHTARVFGVFGWDARTSEDLDDFLRRVRRRRAWLERLARTHDRLIVVLAGTPPWLSRSSARGGGDWPEACAHPPKDPEVWERMVRETVTAFRGIEGAEILYEFWNEPDLHYWKAGLADFLELYERTARAVKAADPKARIGGPAVNQWPGQLRAEKGAQEPLVTELIRFAKRREVPLDFVSWHHFGRPVTAIAEAKAAILAEVQRTGLAPRPELLVTEWSHAGRGTRYAGALLAETMLGFLEAGVDAQTMSCWEEFHPRPKEDGFAPWGMVTQQGRPKSTWHVHRFLDRLSRDASGVAVVREGDRTAVVARKPGGVLEIVLWSRGTDPALGTALDVLEKEGFGRELLRPYRTPERIEEAIRAGEAPSGDGRRPSRRPASRSRRTRSGASACACGSRGRRPSRCSRRRACSFAGGSCGMPWPSATR